MEIIRFVSRFLKPKYVYIYTYLILFIYIICSLLHSRGVSHGAPWGAPLYHIISKVRLAPWIWRLGRLWMLDVASFLKFQISKRTPCFSAQPAACHHGGLSSVPGGRISKCGVWWSTVWESGEIQSVQVWGSWGSWECQGSQHFLPKTCKRRMRTGTKKNTCKTHRPQLLGFQLKYQQKSTPPFKSL